ncbi:excalibur calcium-binding domain-containing protein [Aliarcobacter butzleri]|uniref:excalibur calcium-binding domain-containing protein n=1 Tax=Aliarcobacter butzleri TaxID=28197 RepID=UPI00189F2BA6|nr:excalibur calcium-binding domain-containing protein [Aliarcobacter butzleri]MBF7071227.1 cold-shock protein [Aliarcobacter butzleri]
MHKILIVIILALSLFSAEKEKQKAEVKLEFKCEGKKYCKEMNSCKEAMFYLKQCGVSRLDRDKDGIPCETICR